MTWPKPVIEGEGPAQFDGEPLPGFRVITRVGYVSDGGGGDAFKNIARDIGRNQRLPKDEPRGSFEIREVPRRQVPLRHLAGVTLRQMKCRLFRRDLIIGDVPGAGSIPRTGYARPWPFRKSVWEASVK